jgi:hypothetical protein
MSAERCEVCGRRLDRPSFDAECESRHGGWSVAAEVVEAVEREIHSRKGIGYRHLDDDLVDEIRDAMTDAVRDKLEEWLAP